MIAVRHVHQLVHAYARGFIFGCSKRCVFAGDRDASVRPNAAEGIVHHSGNSRELLGDQAAGDHRGQRQVPRDTPARPQHGQASFSSLGGGFWARSVFNSVQADRQLQRYDKKSYYSN